MSYENDLQSAIFFINKLSSHSGLSWLDEAQNVIDTNGSQSGDYDHLTIGYEPSDDLNLNIPIDFESILAIIEGTLCSEVIFSIDKIAFYEIFYNGFQNGGLLSPEYQNYLMETDCMLLNTTVKGKYQPGMGNLLHTLRGVDGAGVVAMFEDDGTKTDGNLTATAVPSIFNKLWRTQINAVSSNSREANSSAHFCPAIGERGTHEDQYALTITAVDCSSGRRVVFRILSTITQVAQELDTDVKKIAFAQQLFQRVKIYADGVNPETPAEISFLGKSYYQDIVV
jgi:hypothetical protein